MRIEHDPNIPALRREWLGARLMAVLGVLLLLVAVALIGMSLWYGPTAPSVAIPAAGPPPASAATDGGTVVVPTTSAADARRQENIALCTAALDTAQKLGIVPGFATLASDETQNTNVQGRYICLAKTEAARYSLDFDLTCTNLGSGNCISLYTVSQAGGGVLYQRK